MTMTMDNGRYTYSDNIPCNYGSGIYSIIGNKIIFKETSGPLYKLAVYLWWDLDGGYKYTCDGKKLILTREFDNYSRTFIVTK